MQATQLSLIVNKLTEFYGTSFDNFAYRSPLSDDKNYSFEENAHFINSLIEAARKQQLLMIENYANPADFRQLIEINNHPIIFFQHNETYILGRLLKDNKPFFYHIHENQAIEIADIDAYNPQTVVNNPDVSQNGKIIFLTVFPFENIGNDDNVEPLTPLKRLFGLLRKERKDIINIYIYAIVVGIISLSLPLGIQASQKSLFHHL